MTRADHQLARKAGQPRQRGESADGKEVSEHAQPSNQAEADESQTPASRPGRMTRAENAASRGTLRLLRPRRSRHWQSRRRSGKERRRQVALRARRAAAPIASGIEVGDELKGRDGRAEATQANEAPAERAGCAGCRSGEHSRLPGRRRTAARRAERARRRRALAELAKELAARAARFAAIGRRFDRAGQRRRDPLARRSRRAG